MEKFGISRNPTVTGPALLLACNRFLILSSLIDISTLKKMKRASFLRFSMTQKNVKNSKKTDLRAVFC